MGLTSSIAVFVITVIALIVCGVLTIMAAIDVKKIKGYKDDKNLKTAHKYLTWVSVSIWISVFLAIVAGILFAIFVAPTLAPAAAMPGALGIGSIMVYGLGLLIGIGAFICGIYAAKAATEISKSPNYTGDGYSSKAYWYSIGAAIAGIGGLGLIILTYALMFVARAQKKASAKRALKKQQNDITQIVRAKQAAKKETAQIPQIIIQQAESK